MPVNTETLKAWWRQARNPGWICFAWFGMTAGISLLEAPARFRAPLVDRVVALDVGRVVFAALNKAELVALVLVLILVRASGLSRRLWPAIGLLVAYLVRHGAPRAPALSLNLMTSSPESQLAGAVLMIRPARFHTNPMTASSNRFQGRTDLTDDEQQQAALAEFSGLAAALRVAGITVVAVNDTDEPPTPDSIFPNNWISFHGDGTVVLYPMEAENRRTERRPDLIDLLADTYGYQVRRIIDLSHHEQNGHYLEGTGSLVLDRINHVAYACLSTRTHLDPLGDFAQQLDYDVVAFDAVDRNGVPIYHTNVLMNVGETLAVVCLDAIRRKDQRRAVTERLAASGRNVIELTYDQLDAFAGNMLELRADAGQRILAMSAQAEASLSRQQVDAIGTSSRIVSAPLDRIEASAGGSVRCMLAEIHLPKH